MTFDPATLRQDYGDALSEARTCRQTAAVFDFSFVARGRVSGGGALAAVQSLVARNLEGLMPGQIAYAVRVDANGYVLSDVTVWRTGEATYELMSGRPDDIRDLLRVGTDAEPEDLSAATSIFAVQGPEALAVMNAIGCAGDIARLAYFHFTDSLVAGIACRIGRLGFTGEAGFEIIVHRRDGDTLWRVLSSAAQPAGFAAANILRIEAGFILLCNELKLRVTPAELGLAAFAGAASPPQTGGCRLVTFRAKQSGTRPLWQPTGPLKRPQRAGELVATSACTSPLAAGTLGLGFARRADLQGLARPRLYSDDFGEVEVVAHPFYDTGKQRPRLPWVLRDR